MLGLILRTLGLKHVVRFVDQKAVFSTDQILESIASGQDLLDLAGEMRLVVALVQFSLVNNADDSVFKLEIWLTFSSDQEAPSQNVVVKRLREVLQCDNLFKLSKLAKLGVAYVPGHVVANVDILQGFKRVDK